MAPGVPDPLPLPRSVSTSPEATPAGAICQSRQGIFTYRGGTVTEIREGHARTRPFATTLRESIDARGVTLAWLHERLAARGNPVSMATLSYWRSGARRPESVQSLTAIADIEELLHLETDTLRSLLGATQRTGPLGTTAFPFSVDELEERVRQTFLAMGATYPDPTRELTVHSTSDVGADGTVRRHNSRLLVQATSGTISAIPFVEFTPGMTIDPPQFEAVAGGRVSVRHSDPSGEVHGFMFELDRPIVTPETALIEWSVEYPESTDETEVGHAVAYQSRELVVWTRFHPDAVPDWVEEVEETPSGLSITRRELDGARSVHAVRRGFGPGGLAIRWGYGEWTPRPEG